jgi:hypothetical protein
MGFLHIPLNREIPVVELLSDMPSVPKALIRKGFSVVARLPESAHSALLRSALDAAERKPVNDEELAKNLGISVEDATNAVAAVRMFSALASARGETAEELLEALVESDLVTAAQKPTLAKIVPKVMQVAPELNEAAARQRLTEAVLPSFKRFQAVLDIRIGNEDRGGFALPVAIAFLDTDTNNQRLWFQLTRQDVEDLLEKLNSILKRFKEAEELVARWPPLTGGS